VGKENNEKYTSNLTMEKINDEEKEDTN